MVYLYLKNKTFINAHLIKNGLALSDKTLIYKSKNNFIKLEKEYGG
jgi:site-specific DNA-methyltransferase (adenine-specific)